MIDKEYLQELAEIYLNINEAESNEEITAEQAKEARQAIGENVVEEMELR